MGCRFRGRYAQTAFVPLMLFVQNYLQATRQNHEESYEIIQGQTKTQAVLQQLWTFAENLMFENATEEQYLSLMVGSAFEYYALVLEIYSDELLLELDLLGIEHKTLEDLDTLFVALNNANMHFDGIARTKIRKVKTHLLLIDFINDIHSHDVCFTGKTRRMPPLQP